MLNFDNTQLEIFENFVVDNNLPKFKSKDFDINANESSVDGSRIWIPQSRMSSDGTIWRQERSFTTINGQEVKLKKPPLKDRLVYLFKGILPKKEAVIEPEPKPELSVMEFFKSIKNNSKELSKIEKRVEGYVEAMEHAEKMGQTALKEKLERDIDIVRTETQLYASGFKTVITEEQVIEFYKKSVKGIRLDYIKNFTRVIPSKFLNIKSELDSKAIFDNYAVLYFDPKGEIFQLTQKEEDERKKDPILFGLIQGSRKLYYIGDWEDEYCDLTLDNFIDEFGKTAINKNNISATIKISK